MDECISWLIAYPNLFEERVSERTKAVSDAEVTQNNISINEEKIIANEKKVEY